jgi:23S rRNA (uracil1939-C5)-methyltransferase
VNPAVAEALRAYVVARALAYAPATAVDAYAGAGDTAAALAERGVRVAALEIDPEAAAFAADRLPAGSRSLVGSVEARLPDALPADVVVLNPPRGGLHERVPALLEAAAGTEGAPRALVYVSCNPATLARDLGRLPSYTVRAVAGFDMFPQTAHVETVCELIPAEHPPPESAA